MKWQAIALILLTFSGRMAVAGNVLPATGDGTTPVANAAIGYWQAFAALPTFAPEEQQRFDSARAAIAAPVADDVQPLVARFDRALHLMRRASAATACDWELDYAQGPALLLPHLSKVRELGLAALVRAKVRFAANDQAGAIGDVVATLKMARHAASSPLLISVLVGSSLESPAEDLLARQLPSFDRRALNHLAKELAALPAAASIADCFAAEGSHFAAWLEKLSRAPSDERQQITVNLDVATGKRLLEAAAQNQVGPTAITRLRNDYADLARIAALDPYASRYARAKQFDEELARWQASASPDSDHFLASVLIPAISRVIDREIQRDVRRALLMLAVRVQLDGQASLEAASEFHGSTPEYLATPTGYELRYRAVPGGEWEVLAIGKP